MSDSGIQVIDRSFDILELLATEEEGLGITEIARRLDLNKTTVHRIVNAILKRGYIEKTDQGLYQIGLKCVAMASIRLSNLELTTEAKPYLYNLTNILRQVCHLAILDGSDAVYIDKIEFTKNIRIYSEIGRRIPVYCSALGKSLLLDKAPKQVEAILKRCEYQVYTKNTLTTMEQVIAEIEEGRKTGWTIDNEEHDRGICCIAAPIYDYTGKIVAAISTSASTFFYTEARQLQIAEMVKDTATQISKQMGYWTK